ncbi:hypothetical protein E2562_031387 [Oryza meyeriana var. granulata]|uniref:Uncharacterized protein n=1 Tax=Oryza meyeriana var. granulata TaxID=110450 RepID=A0A6G1DSY8_9ORYZ|nr:hypothetical protein E2562_031387 [Oryza meyeriana var. granulata]
MIRKPVEVEKHGAHRPLKIRRSRRRTPTPMAGDHWRARRAPPPLLSRCYRMRSKAAHFFLVPPSSPQAKPASTSWERNAVSMLRLALVALRFGSQWRWGSMELVVL